MTRPYFTVAKTPEEAIANVLGYADPLMSFLVEPSYKKMAEKVYLLRHIDHRFQYPIYTITIEAHKTEPCPFCVGRIGHVSSTCEDCLGSGYAK